MNTVGKIKCFYNFVGPQMPKAKYSKYKEILKNIETRINATSPVEYFLVPTSNRVAQFYGGAEKEVLTTLQSQEYVERIYQILKSKGYKIPKETLFMEDQVPSWSGIGATNIGDMILYNPRSINRLTPRHVFHEIGHLMHEKMQKMSPLKFNWLVKKDKYIPFLSKQEKEVFAEDIKRAYEEKYYRGMPFKYWLKDGLFAFGEMTTKMLDNYRKNAAERNTIYPFTDRFEFVAEVFSLLIQGFKFSPEIMAKYKEFGGPEVIQIIEKKEFDELLKLQNQIRKKTLRDYAVSF